LLDAHGLAGARPDTVVLLVDGRALLRSDAVLAVVAVLPAPWCWLRWLRPLPRRLRDAVYDLIARRRHRWFDRHETCPLPAPEVRDRFLDGR
jgi:predicted DCC family thiol-disulfide oxidoreductase YuxK